MTSFDHDDLPPDLADLGRRMRDERPVAQDDALARMTPPTDAARRAPRRAPRRAFALSLATMLAMVSVTGVAAAGLFGMSFSHIGKALTGSTQKIGTASSNALKPPAVKSTPRAPASTSSSSAKLPSALGSFAGALSGGSSITPSGGSATPGSASALSAPPSATLIPGNQQNAGVFQYGPGRLVCRILRALRLNFVANLLGCP